MKITSMQLSRGKVGFYMVAKLIYCKVQILTAAVNMTHENAYFQHQCSFPNIVLFIKL